MNAEQEKLITENLSIVARVVGREMARGLMPWVDQSDLEDVGNLALVEAAGRFDGQCDFKAFAYQEVRASVLNELKRFDVRTRDRGEMPEDVDVQSAAGRDVELYSALSALQGFSPRQYRIVILHYWNGVSQAAIAEQLGVNQATVSRSIESAKKMLCERIKSQAQLRIYMKGEKGQ